MNVGGTREYIYTYMYKCMYAHMYVCVHVCMYVGTHYLEVCMYVLEGEEAPESAAHLYYILLYHTLYVCIIGGM